MTIQTPEQKFRTLAKIAEIARLLDEVNEETGSSYLDISGMAIGYANRNRKIDN